MFIKRLVGSYRFDYRTGDASLCPWKREKAPLSFHFGGAVLVWYACNASLIEHAIAAIPVILVSNQLPVPRPSYDRGSRKGNCHPRACCDLFK